MKELKKEEYKLDLTKNWLTKEELNKVNINCRIVQELFLSEHVENLKNTFESLVSWEDDLLGVKKDYIKSQKQLNFLRDVETFEYHGQNIRPVSFFKQFQTNQDIEFELAS